MIWIGTNSNGSGSLAASSGPTISEATRRKCIATDAQRFERRNLPSRASRSSKTLSTESFTAIASGAR